MPKNQVSDLITDQEMAFARLVLSGTMNDRDAAEAAGLNPDTAAYTKAKPRVRVYMLEYREAVQQQLLDQESDLSRRAAERLRRKEERREQVLDRLWEIARMSSEMTRGSITGQVKAISMIVAIEGLIPDRRAGAAVNNSAPPLPHAEIYPAVGLGRQQEETIDPSPSPSLAQEEDEPGLSDTETTTGSLGDAPPSHAMPPSSFFESSEPALAHSVSASEMTPSAFRGPAFLSAPDTRTPFSIKKDPFARRR